jgi:hypothetical protein
MQRVRSPNVRWTFGLVLRLLGARLGYEAACA